MTGAPDPGGRALTIADIARDAGVSVPTVSKVLNGRPDVAPATRARVEATIVRTGYRPRRPRGVARTPLIELALHELDSAWSLEIISGIEKVAGPARIGVVLSELGGAHRPRQDWIDDVLTRRPLGVILVLSGLDAAQLRQFAARSIPCVVIDTVGELATPIPTVGSANWSGGMAATRHLIELGHRRIAVISGPRDVLCSRARVDGYRSALEEAGIPLDPTLIRYGDFVQSGGHVHGRSLLDRADRPTAIFAGSDSQALGVMRAARDLGLRIPEDLSIVGYDDLPVSEWLVPPLTTVHQPLRQMARAATRMVLDLARGERLATPRIDLATSLVVRESTAPPPAGT